MPVRPKFRSTHHYMTNSAPRCHLCQPFFFGLIQSSSISSYAMDLKTSKFYSRNNRPIKHWLDMDKSGYSKNIQRQAKVFLRVLKIQPAKINGNIKSFWSEDPRNTMSAFGYCWVPWNTLIMGFTFWRYYDTKWLNFSPYRNSPIWATKVGATKCNYSGWTDRWKQSLLHFERTIWYESNCARAGIWWCWCESSFSWWLFTFWQVAAMLFILKDEDARVMIWWYGCVLSLSC